MKTDMTDTTKLQKVVAFLLGESDLEGRWFGDKDGLPLVSGHPAKHWWRKPLREAIAALDHQETNTTKLRELQDRLELVAQRLDPSSSKPVASTLSSFRQVTDEVRAIAAALAPEWKRYGDAEKIVRTALTTPQSAPVEGDFVLVPREPTPPSTEAGRISVADSVSQEIVKILGNASKEIGSAHALAVKKNPMAQDLPVFQKLLKLQKELGDAMMEVSKVRGL